MSKEIGSLIHTNGIQLITSNLPKFIINNYLQGQSVDHIQAIVLKKNIIRLNIGCLCTVLVIGRKTCK